MKKISIGSWAYCFGPYKDNPVDFHTVVHKLSDLGLDGVELGGFPPHPSPDSHDTPAKRQALKQEVKDHGLEFSGLAANLWMHKLISVPDSGPLIAEFAKNLFFAEDLGMDCIRVDTLEPPDVFERTKTDPGVGRERVVKAWDRCAKLAANRGIRVCWEFEPGFAFNKPSEILAIVEEVRSLGSPAAGPERDAAGRSPGIAPKTQGQNHPHPLDRLRRHAARQRDEHSRTLWQGRSQLGPTHSGNQQGGSPLELVVYRPVLLAGSLGSNGGCQALPLELAPSPKTFFLALSNQCAGRISMRNRPRG